MAADEEHQPDWRPRPDPTVLTTEALLREIGHLRELTENKMDLLREQFEQAMKLHGQIDAERFGAIERRFKDRELLVSAEFAAAKEAVAAALSAAKEAVAKSEDTFNKQIDEIRRTHEATSRGFEKELGGVRERVTSFEGREHGAATKAEGISSATALAIAALVLIISAVGVIATIALGT